MFQAWLHIFDLKLAIAKKGMHTIENSLSIMWEFYVLAFRSSICTSINVIFTPATANGYSQTALLPVFFLKRL